MHKLADQDYKDGFTTELAKTQEQILNYVNEMQPVCQKLIKRKSASKSESTIDKHIRKLLEKDMIQEENIRKTARTITLTENGQRYLQ